MPLMASSSMPNSRLVRNDYKLSITAAPRGCHRSEEIKEFPFGNWNREWAKRHSIDKCQWHLLNDTSFIPLMVIQGYGTFLPRT